VEDREASDSEEDCAFAFTVSENQEETCNATSCNEPVVVVTVDGITAKVLIDSGSVSNLMGMNEYEERRRKALIRR